MARTLPLNQASKVGTAVDRPKHSKAVKRRQAAPNPKAKKKNKLNEPLFPGGITTYGEFLKGRRAAVRAEFRPQEQQINEVARNIPSWYQDYLAKLQGLQQQTTEQYQGLQQQAASLEGKVDETTVAGGTSPEAVAANNARANLVKALQGSLMQQQGAQLGKLREYGAIATARKGQKEDEVSKARKELAQAKGDFRAKYTVEQKQREFENSLAAQQFGLKKKEAKSEAKNRENTFQKEQSKQAAKYGYSVHDWKLLGQKGRAKVIADEQRRSGSKPESLSRIQKKEQIKVASKYGYNLRQWQALKPQQRAAIMRKEGGKKEDGTELSFRTHNQRGDAARQTAQTKQIVDKLRQGVGIPGVGKKGHRFTRQEAAKTILNDPKAPEPVLVSATLDAAYDGHISRATAKRLHAAGFKVNELAQALGVPTYSQWAKSKYNQNPMNALGQIPIAGNLAR